VYKICLAVAISIWSTPAVLTLWQPVRAICSSRSNLNRDRLLRSSQMMRTYIDGKATWQFLCLHTWLERGNVTLGFLTPFHVRRMDSMVPITTRTSVRFMCWSYCSMIASCSCHPIWYRSWLQLVWFVANKSCRFPCNQCEYAIMIRHMSGTVFCLSELSWSVI
jgi:hypothetical protein